MSEDERTQIYLISPAEVSLTDFPPLLAGILDTHDIACVRLALSSTDEMDIRKTADVLRETCHQRDVPLVIQDHFRLVEPLGLDGVHLTSSSKHIRDVRDELGAEAIVGTYCGASRHAGMTSGEIGADYVAFGPAANTALGDGTIAELELFQWWSDMVEVPVVAEGIQTLETAAKLAQITDFLAFGAELWTTEDPEKTLASYIRTLD